MGRLDGKICIVTGASSGIGAATAKMFAKEGAKVVMAARRKELMDTVAGLITKAGGEALVVPTDITEQAQVDNLFAKTMETYGKLDVLVNVAGGISTGLRPIDSCTDEELERIVNTNLRGTLRVTRAATQIFTKQGEGNVVTVSSVSAVTGCGAAVYTATKGALRCKTSSGPCQLRMPRQRMDGYDPRGAGCTGSGLRAHVPGIQRRCGPAQLRRCWYQQDGGYRQCPAVPGFR